MQSRGLQRVRAEARETARPPPERPIMNKNKSDKKKGRKAMATKTAKDLKERAKDLKERQIAFYEEKVSARYERPEGIKENFFTVTLNGKNYQIRYGVEVKIPRAVKLIIDESSRNKMAAEEAAEEEARAFAAGERLLGEI